MDCSATAAHPERCIPSRGALRAKALLERVGARMDDLDRRFDALESVIFKIDALEARVAALEQRRRLRSNGDSQAQVPPSARSRSRRCISTLCAGATTSRTRRFAPTSNG
jgi:hypothetical protein